MKRKRVSCLIPAYNEAPRVGSVLRAVVGHELVDEIILIDDASTDGTKDLVEEYPGIRLIRLEVNRGKSHAVMRGFEVAQHEIILTIDADLIGLTPDAITALLEPVLNGVADVSFSLRKNAPPLYRYFGLDYISGERAFPRSLFPDPAVLGDLKGFELEVFINTRILERKMRLRVVPWENVVSPMKTEKFGLCDGLRRDFLMSMQIARFVGLWGLFVHYKKLHALKC